MKLKLYKFLVHSDVYNPMVVEKIKFHIIVYSPSLRVAKRKLYKYLDSKEDYLRVYCQYYVGDMSKRMLDIDFFPRCQLDMYEWRKSFILNPDLDDEPETRPENVALSGKKCRNEDWDEDKG